MTSHDVSTRSDTPELPESGQNQTDDVADSRPSGQGVVPPTARARGAEAGLAGASQARMGIGDVLGPGERVPTTPIAGNARVPAEPSVRIGKSIPVGNARAAAVAHGVVAREDVLGLRGEDSAWEEQTVCRRRPAQYAVLFAPTSAPPPSPAPSRRPMLLAGLATGLMVACAGYVAMSERAVRLAPQEVIAHPSELQASAAGNDAPRADDVSVLGQREGEPVDVRRQQDQAESSPSYALDLTVEPSDAWIALDGKSVGVGRVQRRLRIDGVEHTLVIGAPGHANRTLTFRDAPPPAHVALDKSVPASSPSPSPRRRPSSDAPEKPRRGANGALILR